MSVSRKFQVSALLLLLVFGASLSLYASPSVYPVPKAPTKNFCAKKVKILHSGTGADVQTVTDYLRIILARMDYIQKNKDFGPRYGMGFLYLENKTDYQAREQALANLRKAVDILGVELNISHDYRYSGGSYHIGKMEVTVSWNQQQMKYALGLQK